MWGLEQRIERSVIAHPIQAVRNGTERQLGSARWGCDLY